MIAEVCHSWRSLTEAKVFLCNSVNCAGKIAQCMRRVFLDKEPLQLVLVEDHAAATIILNDVSNDRGVAFSEDADYFPFEGIVTCLLLDTFSASKWPCTSLIPYCFYEVISHFLNPSSGLNW